MSAQKHYKEARHRAWEDQGQKVVWGHNFLSSLGLFNAAPAPGQEMPRATQKESANLSFFRAPIKTTKRKGEEEDDVVFTLLDHEIAEFQHNTAARSGSHKPLTLQPKPSFARPSGITRLSSMPEDSELEVLQDYGHGTLVEDIESALDALGLDS
jgi:hypothetical protein